MNLSFSSHARTRMRQRGMSENDVRLIVEFGSDVRHGLRQLLGRDIDREVRRLKRRIQDFERLRNCAVIHEDNSVITAYHLHGQAGRNAVKPSRRRFRRSPRRSG